MKPSSVVLLLNEVEDVKAFCKIASKYDFDIDVRSVDKSSKYTLDAKSLMGLFSLDLSKPVIVSVENIEGIEASVTDFFNEVAKFTYKEA